MLKFVGKSLQGTQYFLQKYGKIPKFSFPPNCKASDTTALYNCSRVTENGMGMEAANDSGSKSLKDKGGILLREDFYLYRRILVKQIIVK